LSELANVNGRKKVSGWFCRRTFCFWFHWSVRVEP
jgi:hypothetical protein